MDLKNKSEKQRTHRSDGPNGPADMGLHFLQAHQQLLDSFRV